MYQVELRGKLPSNLIGKEDILTSNVFSFFKYSNRTLFLSALLEHLNLSVNQKALKDALFIFWPIYEDGTEPDLIIVVGKYYLLFEAKYYSGFGKATTTTKSQLVREMISGFADANDRGKDFYLVAITQDYVRQDSHFREILPKYKNYFKWMNWQNVTEILDKLIKSQGEKLPSYDLAFDLRALLEKLNLRKFQSFKVLPQYTFTVMSEKLFFDYDAALFRGVFVGFDKSLSDTRPIQKPASGIFFKQQYFNDLSNTRIYNHSPIFYNEEIENV